jgi:hypothetical protein
MTATMVFIHGRGQEGKDPVALTGDWCTALTAGLAQAGRGPLDYRDVRFPFYGDELFRITAELARTGEPIELESMVANPGEVPLHPLVTTDVGQMERQLMADLLAAHPQVVKESLIDHLEQVALSWRGTRIALQSLAEYTGVDREVIKAHLRDVAVYLTRGRDRVLDIVRQAVPAGDIVLVSHSLGTVVARDLLDDEDIKQRTRLWVTAGAPLALPAVQKNLRKPGTINPGVPWTTTYDVHDIVALGHPLHPTWGDPLSDVLVDNGDAPHSISRYLGHGDVASPIHDAVNG